MFRSVKAAKASARRLKGYVNCPGNPHTVALCRHVLAQSGGWEDWCHLEREFGENSDLPINLEGVWAARRELLRYLTRILPQEKRQFLELIAADVLQLPARPASEMDVEVSRLALMKPVSPCFDSALIVESQKGDKDQKLHPVLYHPLKGRSRRNRVGEYTYYTSRIPFDDPLSSALLRARYQSLLFVGETLVGRLEFVTVLAAPDWCESWTKALQATGSEPSWSIWTLINLMQPIRDSNREHNDPNRIVLDTAILTELELLPEFRGRGLGLKFLTSVFKDFKSLRRRRSDFDVVFIDPESPAFGLTLPGVPASLQRAGLEKRLNKLADLRQALLPLRIEVQTFDNSRQPSPMVTAVVVQSLILGEAPPELLPSEAEAEAQLINERRWEHVPAYQWLVRIKERKDCIRYERFFPKNLSDNALHLLRWDAPVNHLDEAFSNHVNRFIEPFLFEALRLRDGPAPPAEAIISNALWLQVRIFEEILRRQGYLAPAAVRTANFLLPIEDRDAGILLVAPSVVLREYPENGFVGRIVHAASLGLVRGAYAA